MAILSGVVRLAGEGSNADQMPLAASRRGMSGLYWKLSSTACSRFGFVFAFW